jgi:hypothetical protein
MSSSTLNARVHLPPTDNVFHAARHEPELIDAVTKQEYADGARRRDREQRVRTWAMARVEIANAVTVRSACRVDRGLVSDLRVIERQVERVSRRAASSG